jgi:hypothetical protein
MKPTITLDKETNQLLVAILLIAIGVPLILRGVRQGNLLLVTGITLMQRYFSLEERMAGFAEGILSLIAPKQA